MAVRASSRSTSSSRSVSGSARPGGVAARLGGGVASAWLQAHKCGLVAGAGAVNRVLLARPDGGKLAE